MAKDKNEELAEYLEAHKDDPGEWEAESANIRVAREPGVVFSLRIRPSELDRLQKIAERQGTTISALIREAVDRFIRSPGQSRMRMYSHRPAWGELHWPDSPDSDTAAEVEDGEGGPTVRILRLDPEQSSVTAASRPEPR